MKRAPAFRAWQRRAPASCSRIVNGSPSNTQLALRSAWTEIRAQARILGGFVGLLWVIHIVNAVVFGGGLIQLGVHPRSFWGLFGILFAPLLHGSFTHLISNTVPLVVLGALIMQRKKRDLLTVSVLSALVGGLGIWLIAPAASVHIGASILVFGYLGYMLFRGYFERRLWPILGSVAVLLLYGGALFGVLPGRAGISWQGHLFGLLGGILAAKLISKPTSTSTSPTKSRIAASASPELPPSRARIAAPGSEDESVEEELERLRRRGL